MYSVVVCPHCQNVWIVDTSQFKDGENGQTKCGRCRKSREFKRLKKYVKTDDKEEARAVRAKVLAKINGNEEAFQRAHESGALHEEVEDVIDAEDVMEEHGVDMEELKMVDDRMQNSSSSRSQQDILKDAITNQEHPDRDAVFDYAEEHGVARERADEFLEKKMMNGEIIRGSDGAFRFV